MKDPEAERKRPRKKSRSRARAERRCTRSIGTSSKRKVLSGREATLKLWIWD